MDSIGPALAVVAFWTFVTVTAVTGIRYDYRKRQLAVEALKFAIERGHPLDAQALDRLMSPEKATREDIPRHLTVAGIITLSVGVGLVPLAFFIEQLAPKAYLPVMGAATVVLCTALGLLGAGQYLRRSHLAAAESDHTA